MGRFTHLDFDDEAEEPQHHEHVDEPHQVPERHLVRVLTVSVGHTKPHFKQENHYVRVKVRRSDHAVKHAL